MKIGIDFGTTRIVVAVADRGNYPLVNFERPDGEARDWFPSLLAICGDKRAYGWEALDHQGKPGWTVVRSLKRWLKNAGPQSEVKIAGQRLKLADTITEMMAALRRELMDKSTLGARKHDRLQVMLGVPANANSNQRFLTQEAASAAGFEVLGLLNEPSAAAIEFAYRNSSDRKRRTKGGLLVYDLGGGTFDVSLVALGETEHSVIASDGIADFGGDDFDEILGRLVLAKVGRPQEKEESLTAAEWYLLFDECREKKEALNTNSRRLTVDLERVRKDWGEVSISADAFYEQCRPLVEASRKVVEDLLAAHPDQEIDTLYLTGGGSELPSIARVLRETFGRKVRRSAYMRSATAIGLAIRAEGHEARPFRDQFTKHFGVWREADDGRNVVFDVIFPRGLRLPSRSEAPLQIVRSYRPVHNIGYFRYLECAQLGTNNQPEGEITNWDDIRVPFDPALAQTADLTDEMIRRYTAPQELWIEEIYTCDANGDVRVKIHNATAKQTQEYRLGLWSRDRRAKPSRRAIGTSG
ncbi:MAG TPA: Hsp70 family protein [Candidatus Acidoferrum sp.]|nr:Hsp70 family protein [Candidatus Acidoferrum sp.]